MLRLRGLFVPPLRENMEMLYQFEQDYRFDSTKIEKAFASQALHIEQASPARFRRESSAKAPATGILDSMQSLPRLRAGMR